MPGSGRAWNKARATYRAECARTNAPCWLCRGAKGAINYDAPPRTPSSFTVDHADPTSLGADPMRQDRWRPAHYGCNSSRGNTTRGMFPTSRQW